MNTFEYQKSIDMLLNKLFSQELFGVNSIKIDDFLCPMSCDIRANPFYAMQNVLVRTYPRRTQLSNWFLLLELSYPWYRNTSVSTISYSGEITKISLDGYLEQISQSSEVYHRNMGSEFGRTLFNGPTYSNIRIDV